MQLFLSTGYRGAAEFVVKDLILFLFIHFPFISFLFIYSFVFVTEHDEIFDSF